MLVWDYIYSGISALKKRGRLFRRTVANSVITYTEVENPVALTARVTTDANGKVILDYSGFGFAEVYDVQITPIVPAASTANAITHQLVGDPTTTSLTIQAYKPAVAVLGVIGLAVAASIPMFVTVRGRLP